MKSDDTGTEIDTLPYRYMVYVTDPYMHSSPLNLYVPKSHWNMTELSSWFIKYNKPPEKKLRKITWCILHYRAGPSYCPLWGSNFIFIYI